MQLRLTLQSTAFTSLQADNGAIKAARNMRRGMLPVFRKRSFGGVAPYISQLATFNFTSKLQLLWPRLVKKSRILYVTKTSVLRS